MESFFISKPLHKHVYEQKFLVHYFIILTYATLLAVLINSLNILFLPITIALETSEKPI